MDVSTVAVGGNLISTYHGSRAYTSDIGAGV